MTASMFTDEQTNKYEVYHVTPSDSVTIIYIHIYKCKNSILIVLNIQFSSSNIYCPNKMVQSAVKIIICKNIFQGRQAYHFSGFTNY